MEFGEWLLLEQQAGTGEMAASGGQRNQPRWLFPLTLSMLQAEDEKLGPWGLI